MKKSLLISSLILVVILSYLKYNSPDYAMDKTWKYYGGYPSGDIIEYKNTNDQKLAKIQFCFCRYLIVENRENGKLGYYILNEIK